MVNPAIGKAGAKAVSLKQQIGPKDLVKQGPSKFDQVRARAEDRQLAVPYQLPPDARSVTAPQRAALEGDLRRRLSGAGTRAPQGIFKTQMKTAQQGIVDLNRQVSAIPRTPHFEPLRARLTSIEAQFKDSGKLLNGLGSLDSPQDMLKVQVQMYMLTQNIELMSKVVEQVNAGVKQLLQTQV